MADVTRSVHGVPIRLTSERWLHIVEHHDDLAGHYHDVLQAVAGLEAVHAGDSGERLAVRAGAGGQFLVVAYRELTPTDGFVITAFLTARVRQLERRTLLWKKGPS